nr:MAG TPA: hypothetical protein [Caudoviricetes sp.]
MTSKKRNYSSKRCLVFNCSKSYFAWQCCQFCRKRKNCENRCLNNSDVCNSLIEEDGTYRNDLCFRAKEGVLHEYFRQVRQK